MRVLCSFAISAVALAAFAATADAAAFHPVSGSSREPSFHPVANYALSFHSHAKRDLPVAAQPYPNEVRVVFEALGRTYNETLHLFKTVTDDFTLFVNDDVAEPGPTAITYRAFLTTGWISATVYPDGLLHALIYDDGEMIQVDPTYVHDQKIPLSRRGLLGDMIAFYPHEHDQGALCGNDDRHNMVLPRPLAYIEEPVHGRIGTVARNGTSASKLAKRAAPGPGGYPTLWSDCYTGATATHSMAISFVTDQGFSGIFSNDATSVQTYVQSVVTDSNMIYYYQLNIVLQLGNLKVMTTATSDKWNKNNAGKTTTTRCENSLSYPIDTMLTDFTSYRKTITDATLSKIPQWFLFTNCYPPSGTVGLAYVGVLCSTSSNTGVVTYSTTTWKTFAHELGHNYGASHTFQLGQGSTGSIMDYGDGTLDGIYQFHTTYSKSEICTEISKTFTTTSGKFTPCIKTYTATCGNSVVEFGEQCDSSSAYCSSCKFVSPAVCDPAAGSTCCLSNGQFAPSTTSCTDASGSTGFCSNGTCTTSSWCDTYSNLAFCATSSSGTYAGCQPTCSMTGSTGCYSPSSFSASGTATYYNDGTVCATGKKCKSGVCTTDTSAPSVAPAATPTPTPSASISSTPTPSRSPAASATPTPSTSRSPSPSVTPTSTSTPTPTPSSTPSITPTSSATPSPSASVAASNIPNSPSPSTTPTPSTTSTPSRSPTPSVTPTASATVTPTPTPSATATPSVTPTASVTPSATPSSSPSVTPSSSASPSHSPTPSVSMSPLPVNTDNFAWKIDGNFSTICFAIDVRGCGAGVNTRPVNCYNGNTQVSSTYCTILNLDKPATNQSCDTGISCSIFKYQWVASYDTGCYDPANPSATCGTSGVQNATISCVQSTSDNSQLPVTVAASACDTYGTTNTKPAAQRSCSLAACTALPLFTCTEWSTCDTTECDPATLRWTNAKQSRTCSCSAADGKCQLEDGTTDPMLTRPCTLNNYCGPIWAVAAEAAYRQGPCLATCVSVANYTCQQYDAHGSYVKRLPDSDCDNVAKRTPDQTRCVGGACVLSNYTVNNLSWQDAASFGACEGTVCGNLTQTRPLECWNVTEGYEQRVADSVCVQYSVPKKAPVTQACTRSTGCTSLLTSDQTPAGKVSPVNTSIIIGAVVGGVAAIAAVVAIIFFVRRSRAFAAREAEGREKFKVVTAYRATTTDEMDLKEGDIIAVEEQFGDWARGRNERTRKTGTFPMANVQPADTSRMVLVARPDTVYNRVSQFFGRGRSASKAGTEMGRMGGAPQSESTQNLTAQAPPSPGGPFARPGQGPRPMGARPN